VVPIVLPPLRERVEDIPALVQHFLRKHSNRLGRTLPQMSSEAMKCLVHYDWPGNVRQLENTVERVIITAEGDTIGLDDLPLSVRRRFGSEGFQTTPKSSTELKTAKKQLRDRATREIERIFVIEALKRNDWNVTKAAEDVGMQRTNFHALMRKHEIRKDRRGF
jgi:DNA-binding NtrC family response regulator